ncbi:EAL domain-containing protein [Thiolapillus sp.]
MKTLGIRRGMAFILIAVFAAAYYLYDRFSSVKDQTVVSELLFQVRQQDIRLERDVERIISFRLPHYDSLVESSNNIEHLAVRIKAQQAVLGGWYMTDFAPEMAAYLDLLARKRQFVERIQSHVALVRNSLLYVPNLLEQHEAVSRPPQMTALLHQLVTNLYAHYLFPDKLSLGEIQKTVEELDRTAANDANIEELLLHAEASLKNLAKIQSYKQKIEHLEIENVLGQLRSKLAAQREWNDRNAIFLGVALLIIVFLLMIWLWRTLAGLDQARHVAERSHHRLQDAVESLGEAFALFDRKHRLILHNKAFMEFYPWLEEKLQAGQTLEDLCGLNVEHLSCTKLNGEAINNGCGLYLNAEESYYVERVGREKWYLASNRRTSEGGLVCVRTDITDSKKTEMELKKLSRALDQSPASVVITDTNGIIEYVNPKFEQVSGYSIEEAVGQSPAILKSGEKSREEYSDMWHVLKAGKEWRGIFHNKRKGGSLYWESAIISPIRDEDGEISHFIGVKEDITQQRQNEAQILYQATYDLLTGLPNRTLLMDRLRQNLLGAKREHIDFALLFIDLDRFKVVNDLYGHVVGDALMKQVAKRLKTEVREADTVVRFGGDEFVVLLMGISSGDAAGMVARKIIEALSRPFELDERVVNIGASIGITLFPMDVDEDSMSGEEVIGALLSNADMAMYQAKAKGRNYYQFFEQGMQDLVKKHLALEQDLRYAVSNDELRLYYQPVYEAYSNEMVGMEALLRWQHPELGMVNPDSFIPLAEETGLIGEIGVWVFAQACRQVREWQQKYAIRLKLSVNLSARQYEKGFDADTLKHILETTGYAAEYLTLEITENLLLKESERAIEWLHALKSCGISLAVDDFGTGYSSLSYLKRFPVDALKIDRSFVRDLPDDNEDVSLVSAIVVMADSLGIRVVAEGVETEAQRVFLKDIGCDFMQGYLFSRPLPADEMEEKIAGASKFL